MRTLLTFLRRLPEAIEASQDLDDLVDCYRALSAMREVQKEVNTDLKKVEKIRNEAINALRREQNLVKDQLGPVFDHALLFAKNDSPYVTLCEFKGFDESPNDAVVTERMIRAETLRLEIKIDRDDLEQKRRIDPRYYQEMIQVISHRIAAGLIGKLYEPDHEGEERSMKADPCSEEAWRWAQKEEGRRWVSSTLDALREWSKRTR
jgi:hypothetical protein